MAYTHSHQAHLIFGFLWFSALLHRESETVEAPVPCSMVFFTFTGTDMKVHEALTTFALQMLDKVARVKLTKEVCTTQYSTA